MSDVALARRTEPLDGRLFASNGISLSPASPCTRLVLRVRKEGMASVKKPLGFALPEKPKTSVTKGDIHCMWIGPDEWLILDKEDSDLVEKFAKLGNGKLSAVDVSHRNTAILVSGAAAVNAINSGCPQDLSLTAFPVGAASRTMLGKAEIILYRTDETEFRIEVWRSFSDYAWTYIVDAIKSV